MQTQAQWQLCEEKPALNCEACFALNIIKCVTESTVDKDEINNKREQSDSSKKQEACDTRLYYYYHFAFLKYLCKPNQLQYIHTFRETASHLLLKSLVSAGGSGGILREQCRVNGTVFGPFFDAVTVGKISTKWRVHISKWMDAQVCSVCFHWKGTGRVSTGQTRTTLVTPWPSVPCVCHNQSPPL